MRPPPEGLLVVDVSSHQPALDWQAIARAGVVGAYVRVAEGTSPDVRFDAHMKGAAAAGLLVGAYSYCRARHSGAELAAVFKRLAGGGLQLPPVLDVEDLDGQDKDTLHACIASWLSEMGGELPAMIYTGPAFWGAHGTETFSEELLWVAAYTGRTEWPKPARGWSEVTMWQWTDSWEYAPGAPHLDASVFRGTQDELAALANPDETTDVNP